MTQKTPRILNGKIIRDEGIKRLALQWADLPFEKKPHLVIVQVGDNANSTVFIEQKKRFGQKAGVQVTHLHYENTISELDLLNHIKELNADQGTHGIIVQLPLPAHINTRAVIDTIDSRKDVDGLSAVNAQKLYRGDMSGIIPATARGIVTLLEYYNVPIAGSRITIIGRSLLVGRPTALLLMHRNATVTVCHSKTLDVGAATKNADIVIVAAGAPRFFGKDYFREGQVVIDVGITSKECFGDVCHDQIESLVEAYSPVPGGIGPMTVLSLFENLNDAFEKLQNK